jgi:predicted nuclease with TOPRIM domain
MQTVTRENWIDERLGDLNEKVDRGFADVGERFREVDKRFEQVDKRFEQVDKRFDKLDDRFEALQKEMNLRFEGLHKNLLQALLGIMGVTITGFVGLASLIIASM